MVEQKSHILSRKAFLLGGVAALTAFGREQPANAQEPKKPIFAPNEPVATVEQVLLFSQTYDPSQRSRFEELVKEQESYILENKYHGIGETERMQEFIKLREKYKGMIDTVVVQNNISLGEDLQNTLLGIILVESKGKIDAENRGAIGLCQITQSALAEIEREVPEIWNRNMYVPEENIFAAAKYLEIMKKRYGKPEFALWAYHVGGGTLWQGIKAHLVFEGVKDLEEQIDVLPKTDQNAPIIQKYEKQLTIPALMDSPAMQGVFNTYKGSEKEGARTYVSRVLAAERLLAKAT